jgi:hypothetical protein
MTTPPGQKFVKLENLSVSKQVHFVWVGTEKSNVSLSAFKTVVGKLFAFKKGHAYILCACFLVQFYSYDSTWVPFS